VPVCHLPASRSPLLTIVPMPSSAAGLGAALHVGRTGDTLGATIAITEVAICTTLLALWR
jgi:hypothetical protein